MILITHDLGVVAGMCDTVCVMYAGKIVEKAKTEDLYKLHLRTLIPSASSSRSPD